MSKITDRQAKDLRQVWARIQAVEECDYEDIEPWGDTALNCIERLQAEIERLAKLITRLCWLVKGPQVSSWPRPGQTGEGHYEIPAERFWEYREAAQAAEKEKTNANL